MFTRYASAASSSILVTFGLLFLMQFLISLKQANPVMQTTQIPTGWIHFEKPDTPVQPEEIIPKEKLTQTIPQPKRVTHQGPTEGITVTRTLPHVPTTNIPPPGAITDGPLVAMIRVTPIYPARAIAKGIEGYAIVRFDVTANGLVGNVTVVESSHGLFEKSAVEAARKFKFKPRIVDGVAYETYGIQNLFRFNLDDR